jgi:hypothetical protein
MTLALALAVAGLAYGAGENCAGCHDDKIAAVNASQHVGDDFEPAGNAASCLTCHEGADVHRVDSGDPASYPNIHWTMEKCGSCHLYQYASFLKDIPGRTKYGGSQPLRDNNDPFSARVEDWSKTLDLPYWNVLIDGHPFIIETFEERTMRYNISDAVETRRPMGESCITCHGSKMAYYMELPTGPGHVPKARTVNTTQFIHSGNFDHWLDATPNLVPSFDVVGGISGIWIPAGTTVSTYVDPYDATYPHQVKSEVNIPAFDGKPLRRYTSHFDATATASGSDPLDGAKRLEARTHIWAALTAFNRDGLMEGDRKTYQQVLAAGDVPADNQHSLDGVLCNQCHDPHSGKLRIIQKGLIQAVKTRGVNPTDPAKAQIKDFNLASRQDQIIMVCGQCHSEYVGGYSGIDNIDRHYFPWAKPREAEQLYIDVADYKQDTIHGKELGDEAFIINDDYHINGNVVTLPTYRKTRPWQSVEPNARGYFPEDGLFGDYNLPAHTYDPAVDMSINKTQHPEAETFWGSKMYNAGATCIDCHTARATRPDGTRYTSHWFASPIKYIRDNIDPPINPCAKCHQMTGTQAEAQIYNLQDQYFALQERAQVALVNSLKYIQGLTNGSPEWNAAVANHKLGHFLWEYYAQGENSMSFHNRAEAVRETAAARTLAAQHVPWPLPPTQLKVASAAANSLTISFFDQATNETHYVIQRKPAGVTWASVGAAATIATIPGSSPASSNKTLTYQDNGLTANTDYVYRIAGLNGSGQSSWSIELAAKTAASNPPAVPTAPSNLTVTGVTAVSIFLQWTDNSDNEQGFTVERALNNTFTSGLATFNTGPNATTFADSGLAKLTTYYYRVRAFNLAGPSGWSNVVSAKTKKK